MIAETDRTVDGSFEQVYYALTDNELLLLQGNFHGETGFSGVNRPNSSRLASLLRRFVKKKKPQKDKPFDVAHSERISRAEIEAIEVLDQACNGMVCMRKGETYRVLSCFSMNKTKQIHRFARLSTILLSGKEIRPEDTSDDEYIQTCPKCGRPYPDQEALFCPHCQNRRSLWIRLLKYLRPYKWRYLLVIFLMFVTAGINLLRPYLTGTVFIDDVLTPGGRYYGQVLPLIIIALSLGVANQIVGNVLRGRINARISTEMSNDIRTEIFNALQRLSMTFFGKHHTGSLMTRVNDDAGEIQYFFIDALPFFFIQFLNMLGIAVYLFVTNWKVALAVMIPLPVVLFLVFKFFPKIRRFYDRIWVANSSINSSVSDTINGSRVIRAFSTESGEIERFSRKNENHKSLSLRLKLFQSTFYPLFQLLIGLSLVLIWGFGSVQILDGQLTIGELSTMITYITLVYGPMGQLSEFLFWWSNATNSAQRIFEVLDAVPDIADAPDAVPVEQIDGRISIRSVSFSYLPSKPILTDISVDIEPGQMMGIVGHSGAGKSTLVNLVNRLYDVKLGSISIDGTDIRKMKNEDLKRFIGVVSQETYIFIGTVWENIAFAKPGASKEEIVNAAVSAHAHEFIMKLPDGYDTVIGSGIRELSGGERQRLSIARAILHDPRILILDEATSAVDTETERHIQESLDRLVKDRTTISIAHRISTLRNADFIIVIENGRIVEKGTHDELIRHSDGVYYKLHQLQVQALAIKGV
ncbi:MAG: ATP-binding cassette domain-containing protein [Eubacteriales bacterium]|nr:ATP-binding cassette domain-containing protein [Eubacteriales bacterium]